MVLPILILCIYTVIQIILLLKYRNTKLWLKINGLIILSIMVFHYVVNVTVLNILFKLTNISILKSSNSLFYVYILLYILKYFLSIVLLIIGIVLVIKYKKNKATKLNIKRISYVLCVILFSLMIIHDIGPNMYILEYNKVDSDLDVYSIKFNKNINENNWDIIDIDNDGITVEYTTKTYENSTSKYGDYIAFTKTLKQKLNWNIKYEYCPSMPPDAEAYNWIGSTCFIFEK